MKTISGFSCICIIILKWTFHKTGDKFIFSTRLNVFIELTKGHLNLLYTFQLYG